jgi:diaminobutyrate-2-oxoglutarate transaminase
MTQTTATAVFHRYESQVRSYCRNFPVVFERAAGHHLWDTAGRRYVDLLCAAGSLNYGHNPPPIVDRVVAYLAGGGPIQSLDLHTTAKAEFLHRFSSEILDERGMRDHVLQFPGPAGTLAVEAALKLARKATGRPNVVAFTGGFHGASLGSLALTSSRLLRGAAGLNLPGTTILPYDDGDGSAGNLEAALRPGGRIGPPAAFLLETVQGEGGLSAASRPWLARIRRLADEVGALVIVDDVQAGCGRTGRFFSFEHVPDLAPDIVCLSKSLSGLGLPMAMLVVRRDRDVLAPGEHNGTFRGQNLAFVGATAALDYWTDPDFEAHTARLAVAIRETVRDIVVRLPEGTAVPAGRGAMSGLRFADAGVATSVRDALFRASVIAETSGDGRVLKLLPPLTMSLGDWAGVAGKLADVVVGTATRTPLATGVTA